MRSTQKGHTPTQRVTWEQRRSLTGIAEIAPNSSIYNDVIITSNSAVSRNTLLKIAVNQDPCVVCTAGSILRTPHHTHTVPPTCDNGESSNRAIREEEVTPPVPLLVSACPGAERGQVGHGYWVQETPTHAHSLQDADRYRRVYLVGEDRGNY